MLALQQPVNDSTAPSSHGSTQDFSNTLQQQQQQQQQQHHHHHQIMQQQHHQQQQQYALPQQATPVIQIQSLGDSRQGSFQMQMQQQQQLQAQLQLQQQQMQQQQQQRPVAPLEKPGSSWMVNDFPPLPSSSSNQPNTNQNMVPQSFNPIHPLQHQPLSRPASASSIMQHQQQQHGMQGQIHLLQQQHQLPHFQRLEVGQGMNPHLSSPIASSIMDTQHYQSLNQDSSLGFDHSRWTDSAKGGPQMDMSHFVSPPLTPSGAMARSPNSYISFGMNNNIGSSNNNIKRPPMWPMDRAPAAMPFPRQTPTPSLSSKAANLQHIPCKFFKSGACTAGKNCLFSHNRDPPSEAIVCKYFLKGNCKFGAKCSLSHSFLASDRKTSALLPGGSLGRNRLERRASSGAILNNIWPSEPLSPPYGPSPPQQQTLHLNNNNIEISMGRSPNQQGYLRPTFNRAASENLRSTYNMNPAMEIGGSYSSFSEDGNNTNQDPTCERVPTSSVGLLEHKMRQHLAAPLPIRQRSLPDIFRLTPLSHEGSALPTSPFYQPGNKGLFLSVSCEGDVHPPSPSRLHPIPELHGLYNNHGSADAIQRRGSSAQYYNGTQEDQYSDSDDDLGSDQGFLPSSLNDLLTTHERQRRQSRQDDVEPRSSMLPSPASGSVRDDKDEDEAQSNFGSSSTSVSGSAYTLSNSDSRSQFQGAFTALERYGGSMDASTSPLAMLIPNRQMSVPHPFDTQSSYEDDHAPAQRRGSHYKEGNTTPDPFCPFPQDAEEVQFAMDDDTVTADAAEEGVKVDLQAPRAGLFGHDSTSSQATINAARELNRAVRSKVNMEEQEQQASISPATIDFSSLSISEVSTSTTAAAPMSYAGITKSQTGA
ncbi:hypothetical protein BGZ51_009053 [Haplosporangium sp. Z 767]|nr:hypothetical protein BGZ51_009053 [Haplosporangium sp. Z 767]